MKINLNKKITRILTITGYVAIAGVVLVLMSFANHRSTKVLCEGVVINIEDESIKGFVDRSDVMEMILSKGKKIIGSPLVDINTNVLEKIIDANPYVFKSEVYSTIDGWVHVDIKQRSPVLRIINSKDESFYIDDRGKFMPLAEKYSEPVLVANGNLNDTYVQQQLAPFDEELTLESDSLEKLPVLTQLFLLAEKLKSDSSWDAMFEQIYVNENNEIELIPRLGNQVILIGDITNLNQKLEKLDNLYKHGLPSTGWEQYELINLKYKNQVVCKRKDNKQS
ncbi:MAG TPA: hypothetical protein PKN14_09460 [Bacteroidia bacterium]|nr:hypothetical protein [Bacteroidia bacterium]OQB63439.1 MAG: hypothetical protein BWX95_00946 [Bacteroidetes bacterium ADurb.Bin141]HNR49459.1 hypothetical protein [Bacteroidia bacterium]HNT83078.1 hypothetical protein [Bacteroidia bacterium]